MTFEPWLGFALALVIAVAIPGPVAILVLGRAGTGGWRGAWSIVGGVMLGGACALAIALLGLGAVLATWAAAFTVVKWAGVAYLVRLGMMLWRSPMAAAKSLPPCRAFRDAFAGTVLNPKSTGFFVAFVSQFLDPTRPYTMQAAGILLTFVGIGGASAILHALLAVRLGKRVRAWFNLAGGTALVGAGLATAAMSRA